MRPRLIVAALVLVVSGLGLFSQRAALNRWLFNLTGEVALAAQVRALGQLATDLIRPPLNLQPEVPIQHNGVNPFGVNTFLQQEVEPAKRGRQVQLIAEAGFHWLRQEFPWADIEISGKGNFQDCRNGPCISAWDKYDNIVNLARGHGLEIIARLSSPPNWSRGDGNAHGDFAPPDNFADFGDYASAIAERYRGRIRYYQIWNEPNIFPEWGNQPADPEAYTRLLCQTYTRLKAVDPDIVVLSGVLAPTSELGADNGTGGNNLNDFIFLQRMYAAGARDCFDILSVQGYGLWSGPTDHRMRPIVVNYARNQFIRDLMVANGDQHKAIWISEMNWNAVPDRSGIAPTYGRVTEGQQADYAPLAYQRAQEEWPWVGVNMFWFFKRASDAEKDLAWYYFRMLEPDFTPLPVYESMKAYMHQTPVMYPGWFQEDHWAVTWDGSWSFNALTDPGYTFGVARMGAPGDTAHFTFSGTDLTLVVTRGPESGRLTVKVDDVAPRTFDLRADEVINQAKTNVARDLPDGLHTVELVNTSGLNLIDGFIVRRVPDRTWALLVWTSLIFMIVWLVVQRKSSPT